MNRKQIIRWAAVLLALLTAHCSLLTGFAQGFLINSYRFGSAEDPSATSLTNSLVAYWRFASDSNDGFGSNNLTQNNSPTFTGSKLNLASTSSQYCSLVDNAAMSVDGVSSWAFACVVSITTKGANRYIVSKGDAGSTAGEYYLIYNNSLDRFRMFIQSGASTAAVTDSHLGSPSTSTDYFIVISYDSGGTGTITIQINNGTADTASASSLSIAATSEPFLVGAKNNPVATFWNGSVQKMAFWKRIPTADELTYLYNGGTVRTYTGGKFQ